MFNENELKAQALDTRRQIVELAFASNKAAHFGGALSSVEMITYLYNCFLKYDINNKTDENRDRFILSKGHCVLGYYITLCRAGFFDRAKLETFEQDGGDLLSHPVRNPELGIESSNGSLGQGLSFAVGQQLYARTKGLKYRNVVLMGDGECDEGSVWEAALSAAHYGLSRLIAVVDCNGLQSDGFTEDILKTKPLLKKWDTVGFDVYEVNGHDLGAIHSVFSAMNFENGKPKLVLSDTVKGKGISFMENDNRWHHEPLTKELYEKAAAELA